MPLHLGIPMAVLVGALGGSCSIDVRTHLIGCTYWFQLGNAAVVILRGILPTTHWDEGRLNTTYEQNSSFRPTSASASHLLSVRVAVVAEPEAQELLVDVLRLLPRGVAFLVAARQPVAAGVWRVDLRPR